MMRERSNCWFDDAMLPHAYRANRLRLPLPPLFPSSNAATPPANSYVARWAGGLPFRTILIFRVAGGLPFETILILRVAAPSLFFEGSGFGFSNEFIGLGTK